MPSTVLVTGGTGTLGSAVVQRVRDGGSKPRVLSRRDRPGDRPDDTAEDGWVRGDLRSGEGIREAVSGVDTVVHCATTNGSADARATRNLVEVASKEGTPHLVYISIVGIDEIPMFYYQAKLESERLITESGLPWTILRATQFHNLVAAMTSTQRFSPVVMAPSGVRFQPVDVGEVADRLAALAAAEPAGRVADLGGPQVRDARDLARAWLRAHGRSRPVLGARLPGRIFAAYREGAHLAPEHADGTVTFERFLAGTGRAA